MATEKIAPKPTGPKMVKALEMGYYDGRIVNTGEVFANTLNLKTKGEGADHDPNAWFVDTDQKPAADDLA